jgi:endonuclease/exonuclease/phosphatase family metal-dependent hydrolase
MTALTRLSIPAACLAMLALLSSCAPRAMSGAGPASDESIRVLVYNIHAGKDAAGKDNLDRIAALVRARAADVVLLQEVDKGTQRSGGVDQPAVLARLTGLHVAFGKTLDFQGGEYGIAILSRWPIKGDTLIHLAVDPPQERAGGSYEPRGMLRIAIDAPLGPVTVINTHLDPSRDDHWRRQEMRIVASLANAERVGSAGMLLVGGDFNSPPESPEQNELRTTGLRDAWIVCGRGPGLTYPADSAIKRIDYLFLTGRASCTNALVLESDASDHRPLVVNVQRR